MSREIDPEKIANGTLDDSEKQYLAERNLLPANYQEGSGGSTDDGSGSTDDDDEELVEDYDEGWTNETRVAELDKRGLDSSGNKDELIARLMADDESKA